MSLPGMYCEEWWMQSPYSISSSVSVLPSMKKGEGPERKCTDNPQMAPSRLGWAQARGNMGDVTWPGRTIKRHFRRFSFFVLLSCHGFAGRFKVSLGRCWQDVLLAWRRKSDSLECDHYRANGPLWAASAASSAAEKGPLNGTAFILWLWAGSKALAVRRALIFCRPIEVWRPQRLKESRGLGGRELGPLSGTFILCFALGRSAISHLCSLPVPTRPTRTEWM